MSPPYILSILPVLFCDFFCSLSSAGPFLFLQLCIPARGRQIAAEAGYYREFATKKGRLPLVSTNPRKTWDKYGLVYSVPLRKKKLLR
jgi:hypothetical protein